MPPETNFSSLLDYDSVEAYLQQLFFLSKSQLKKSELSKNFLQKAVHRKDQLQIPLDLANNLEINPKYLGKKIEIIFKDDQVAIFNKPYNLHSHPLNYTGQDNCLSFFRKGGRNLGVNLNINKLNYGRGLLYRLDYGTSGVMFYINDEGLLHNLRENFSKLVKKKSYLAIVSGEVRGDGAIESYFKYIGSKDSKAELLSKNNYLGGDFPLGKLEYVVRNYNSSEKVSLLEVSLITGLRHQIRAQLASIGHPILGDTLYGGKEAARIFLHAYKYEVEIGEKKYVGKSLDAELFSRFFDLDCGL